MLLPTPTGLFAPLFLNIYNCLKEVLALLGRLLPAVVRPPFIKLEGHEIERLKQVACGRRALPRAPKRVYRQ